VIYMNPTDQAGAAELPDHYAAESGKDTISYTELCSEFLTSLAKSIKNAALYTLSHPMVIESVRRNSALVDMIFSAGGENAFTLTFMNDNWLFNDTAVPAITRESQNLNAFFKAHGIQGLDFLKGVRLFEIGVLCEFLGTAAKNQPEGYLREFFAKKGVTNIRPETVHYVKDRGYIPQAVYGKTFETPGHIRPAAVEWSPPGASGPSYSKAVASESPSEITQGPRRKSAAGEQPRETAPGTYPGPAVNMAGASSQPFGEKQAAAVVSGPRHGQSSGARPGGAAPVSGTFSQTTDTKAVSGQASGPVLRQEGHAHESVLSKINFGDILTRLVDSAVNDPKERVHVYEDALKLIRENMEAQVARTTKALVEEKERAMKTRARTERVLSKVAEGKVIVDKEGKVLMMNTVAEEISGKKFIDVVGKHISEQLNPGEHFLTISGDMDLSGGKPLSGEVRLDGDENVGSAMRRSVALLEDDEGRVVGTYSTLPDITKFKEAQRMQEEFLSRVTHDLQSPLSSISSALEMLTDTAGEKLDLDEKKFLSISIRNSQRLTQMIRGILDFSKLQSGKMIVRPEPVSAAAMLAEAGDALLPWAKTKGLTLAVWPPDPDIMVMADYPRIVQVLTNLISNAIKSTPKGGAITVASSRIINTERNVIIGVRDTGRGIPAEDLKKLFKKFVQIESPGAPREGVGLGLAIVREFVALHGGRIWADSEVGKGTTFYFTLPLAG